MKPVGHLEIARLCTQKCCQSTFQEVLTSRHRYKVNVKIKSYQTALLRVYFLENNLMMISAILRHTCTCTRNVSPHVYTCTVVHVYEIHTICISKSGIQAEAFYNTKYMVTNNPSCYTAPTIRLSMIWPYVHL